MVPSSTNRRGVAAPGPPQPAQRRPNKEGSPGAPAPFPASTAAVDGALVLLLSLSSQLTVPASWHRKHFGRKHLGLRRPCLG
jgi:hypothetical protein